MDKMNSPTRPIDNNPPRLDRRLPTSPFLGRQPSVERTNQPGPPQRTTSNISQQSLLAMMLPSQRRVASYSDQERRALLDVSRQPSSSSRTTLSTMERRELLGIILPPAYHSFHHSDADFIPRTDDPESDLPTVNELTDAELQYRRKKETALLIVMVILVGLNGVVLWVKKRAEHAKKPDPFQDYLVLWPVIPCLWVAMGYCGYLFFL